jgi:hypothetical protein
VSVTKRPLTARLVDRASGQVIREFVLDGLTPDEQTAWYIELTKQFDLAVRCRLEFPDHFEENDL